MYGRGFSLSHALGLMDPNLMELGSAMMRPTMVASAGGKPRPQGPARPVDWERVLIDRILRDIRDPKIIPFRYE